MAEEDQKKAVRLKSRQSLAHVSSRSNTTTDIAALKQDENALSQKRKTRGKSLGPGGLEALTETNLNVLRIAPAFQPRSILKPSIPLTPPKTIPSFDDLHRKSDTKASPPARQAPEDLLIDLSTPGPNRDVAATTTIQSANILPDPFSPIKTDNPAEADAEANARWEAERAAIVQRRNERRKSLANRRVSFAPEATLHTWSVMELVEDSTTSSATNSTRRQSSIAAAQSPAAPSGSPKTSDHLANPAKVEDTPANLSNFDQSPHRQKRRRISDGAQESEDDSYSSPGDRTESSPMRVEESIDSDSDTDGDTAMSLDEPTQTSVRSSASSGSQTSIDERLRQAASQAGFGFDNDETEDEDDQTMEIAEGTTTHAFKPYSRPQQGQQQQSAASYQNGNSLHGIEESREDVTEAEFADSTMGRTMDMTRAVGGIVAQRAQPTATLNTTRRKSLGRGRRSSAPNDTILSDETMDLTVAKGGILSSMNVAQDDVDDSDEEMTMEMTGIVGGFQETAGHETSISSRVQDTASMDMTMAVGTVLAPIEERTEPQSFVDESQTMQMELTKGVGNILTQSPNVEQHSSAVSTETTSDPTMQLAETPIQYPVLSQSEPFDHRIDTAIQLDDSATSPANITSHPTPAALESGSPILKHTLSKRRSIASTERTSPRRTTRLEASETKSPATPSKQLTPAPSKSVSAKRTPVLSAKVTTRSASPKKLFVAELHNRKSPSSRGSPRTKSDPLFLDNEATGRKTPRIVLDAPRASQHLRRRSGDAQMQQDGAGSPAAAQLLNRRKTIGEVLTPFVFQPGKPQLEKADPISLQSEVDAERIDEHRRESARFLMEQEANEHVEENTTQNLRNMIESMTPQKEAKPKTLKGRKSLATGSAKGLLGKRPAELDMDDDESTPKRLRPLSRNNSPIKKASLPRQSTALQGKAASQQHTPSSHRKMTRAQSPDHSGRFRSPVSDQKATLFSEKLDNVVGAMDVSVLHPELDKQPQAEEKIPLQDFLNMINIHFIELSTTKRRYTQAQHVPIVDEKENVLPASASTFVAGATTLPLLELYQHATRELKSYISSGRDIIQEIENATLEEQPSIFKEYLEARPEIKTIMDQCFRNCKTNARLQSREGWYSWRSELTDGLRIGLQSIYTDLSNDLDVLTGQQNNTEGISRALIELKQRLVQEAHELGHRLHEHEIVDQASMDDRRQTLARLDLDVEQRSRQVTTYEREMNEKEEVLAQVAELREELRGQTQEAARVQTEQSRWREQDLVLHKATMNDLEQQFGWKLTTATTDAHERVMLILQYRDVLELKLCPSRSENMALVKYAPSDCSETCTESLSTEREFFIAAIQSQLEKVTTPQICLTMVSEGWLLAEKVASEIKSLRTMGIVKVISVTSTALMIRVMVLQAQRSRVDIEFTLTIDTSSDGVWSTSSSVMARPMYGAVKDIMDKSKTRKVEQALAKEIGSKALGDAAWSTAAKGFKDWLDSQGKAEDKANAIPSKVNVVHDGPKSVLKQPAEARLERRRATTQSPQRTATPKKPTRSPLAPKTTNSKVPKKGLPVPKKVLQPSQESQIPVPCQQKENVVTVLGKPSSDDEDVFGSVKPAIPPDMQEAMLQGTPRRRVGALRRSPI